MTYFTIKPMRFTDEMNRFSWKKDGVKGIVLGVDRKCIFRYNNGVACLHGNPCSVPQPGKVG